jgi:membrane fusion protein, multidrug efflux system
VRAELPNPDRVLIAGQFVGVRVERGEHKRVLAVPQAATPVNHAGPYLLVVDNDDRVEARRVRLGASAGVQVLVEDGLNEGDKVIVEGIRRARPGMAVAVSEGAPARHDRPGRAPGPLLRDGAGTRRFELTSMREYP